MLLIVQIGGRANAAAPECHGDTISMLVSPDNKWAALVQEDICSDGAFITVLLYRVQVVRRGGKPTRDNDVLTFDAHGNSKDRPQLSWLSANRLQVTTPNKSLVGLKKERYEAVDVIIKYEPDDPAERERWLREEFGLAPK
jgi:hypothetical protein